MIFHYKDIEYSSHERNIFDIFIPDKPKNTTGAVLYIHGGGWSKGDKSVHFNDADFLAENGYIAASMNYRFVSESVEVFHELDDIASCLDKIKIFCQDKGYYLKKVLLCGVSAGAHLSMLYAYHYYNNDSLLPIGVCAYCPPVNCYNDDFLYGISEEFDDWKYDLLSKCCGKKMSKETFSDAVNQDALKKISPIEYISDKTVPTAVFHGKHDDLVPVEHIYEFIDKLNYIGVYSENMIFPDSDHSLNSNSDYATSSKKIIVSFAERFL